jgi:hypothetical protein
MNTHSQRLLDYYYINWDYSDEEVEELTNNIAEDKVKQFIDNYKQKL